MNEQQAIDEITKETCSGCMGSNNNETPRCKECGYKMAIEALEKQINDRWIPCSKRLPDNEPSYIIGTTYYITTSNGTVRIAKYKERKWIESFGRTIAYNDVVAWKKRIIPEPYKEGEE